MTKMKMLACLILLFSFMSVAQAKEGETAFQRVERTGVLRCGFIPWPPAFEVDPNTNEVKGESKALFESIIKLTGWKVEYVQVALGSDALDLNSGRIDAMCAAGPWVITSVKFVDYTTPVIYSPVFVYVRADDTRFKSYQDLDAEGVSFAGIDGDLSTDLAALRFPKAKIKTLINLTDPAQLMLEVATGKADAVIIDPQAADAFMASNPGKIAVLAVKEPLAVYPIGLSVKRGEAELQQTLSRASEMAINIGLVDKSMDVFDPERRKLYAPARTYKLP